MSAFGSIFARSNCALGHQELDGEHVNGFPLLIEHCASQSDDTLIGFGARGRDFDNFAFDAQDVARTRGSRPGNLSAKTDDAVREWRTTVDQEPHGCRGGVPTAGYQSFEDTFFGSGLVKMERLRVKLRGELLDPRLFHEISPCRESL